MGMDRALGLAAMACAALIALTAADSAAQADGGRYRSLQASVQSALRNIERNRVASAVRQLQVDRLRLGGQLRQAEALRHIDPSSGLAALARALDRQHRELDADRREASRRQWLLERGDAAASSTAGASVDPGAAMILRPSDTGSRATGPAGGASEQARQFVMDLLRASELQR